MHSAALLKDWGLWVLGGVLSAWLLLGPAGSCSVEVGGFLTSFYTSKIVSLLSWLWLTALLGMLSAKELCGISTLKGSCVTHGICSGENPRDCSVSHSSCQPLTGLDQICSAL